MLLSFERPAHRRWLVGSSEGPGQVRLCLLADLENCTVANVIGYQGDPYQVTLEKSMISPTVFAQADTAITVKIVRAHGGCLGTKSR